MEPRKQSALNYVRHLVSQTSIVTPRGGGGKRGGVPVQHFVERSTVQVKLQTESRELC